MDTEQFSETGHSAMAEADRVWRANPVPVIIGALAAGLVIGALLRGSEPPPKTRAEELRDRFGDTEDYVRELVKVLGKGAKKKYKESSSMVKDTLEKAADAARGVDVDDYVDPAGKWLRKLFKRCCD